MPARPFLGISEVSTHSRAEAAADQLACYIVHSRFQHTAARRRLPRFGMSCIRPMGGFNTQPRGGGCLALFLPCLIATLVSTHSRAEAAAFDLL